MNNKKIVGVFINTAVQDPHLNCLTAFCHGVRTTTDHLVFLSNSSHYMQCDVAVMFGSWKNRDNPHHVLKNDIREKHNGDFLVLETPLLGRTITEDHKYYRVGKNHYMDTLGGFNNKNSEKERWGILRTDLNIEVKEWRKDGKHILFLMQLPGDASTLETNILQWLQDNIIECKKHSKRPIKVRMHPLISGYDLSKFEYFIKEQDNVELVKGNTTKIEEDLKDCWATVSFTSGGSVDSMLNGVPVITPSNLNFTYPISSHSLKDIEKPTMKDRQQLLQDLAFTQWTVTEMAHGLPWKHLMEDND